MTTIEDVAYFLLTKPPLDELTDGISGVVEKYRYKMWTKTQSAEALIEMYEDKLQEFLDTNLELASLV
jgi:hypothetical protein